jgi:hypothetical protein
MRPSYREIRRDLLDTYLTGCASNGSKGWTHEEICSWAYFEYDGVYETPIENLMLEVSGLALTGGWYPDLVSYHRQQILKIIAKTVLPELLSQVNEEDSQELVRDLKVLDIIK